MLLEQMMLEQLLFELLLLLQIKAIRYAKLTKA
jgi:hypothetical protein